MSLATTLAGCAQTSYRQLQLGQPPSEYDRTLPAEQTRRTDLGLCYLASDRFGRTDAIVVLLTHDRRIAGKLHAVHRVRDLGWKTETAFILTGEIDLKLADLGQVSPFDAARAILADLTAYQGEKFALDAHAWIAAGLTRLLQRWPHLADSTTPPNSLTPTLDRIPGGGQSSATIDGTGALRLEYRYGEIEGV